MDYYGRTLVEFFLAVLCLIMVVYGIIFHFFKKCITVYHYDMLRCILVVTLTTTCIIYLSRYDLHRTYLAC